MKLQRKKLCVTYDNSFMCDGAGAQIQRIASIYGIAKKYHCKFAKTKIIEIDSNPGDGIKSVKSKDKFIMQLNEILVYPLGDCSHSNHSIVNPKLNWLVTRYSWYRQWIFINNLLHLRTRRPLISMNHTMLSRSIPPDVFSHYPNKIKSNPNYRMWKTNKSEFEIQVQLSAAKVDKIRMPERYLDIQKINVIVKKAKILNPNWKVLVHTDVGLNQEKWKAIGNQSQETLSYWKSRGIIEDSGKIVLNRINLIKEFDDGLIDKVISGISPLDVWRIMVNSKILICGKSSLSFVGALLANSPDSVILFPKGFVKLPREWIEIDYDSDVEKIAL